MSVLKSSAKLCIIYQKAKKITKIISKVIINIAYAFKKISKYAISFHIDISLRDESGNNTPYLQIFFHNKYLMQYFNEFSFDFIAFWLNFASTNKY